MHSTKPTCNSTLTALLAGVVTASVAASPVAAASDDRFVYSVKFVCGTKQSLGAQAGTSDPVTPGRYSTVVSVHNPHAAKAYSKEYT